MKRLKSIIMVAMLVFFIASCAVHESEQAFSIIVMPDTQNYAWKFPNIFFKQTKWIADSEKPLNIKHVVHVGDVTENNTRVEWQVAQDAFSYLDEMSYTITIGNHDVHGGDSLFSEYFPVADARLMPHFGGLYVPYEMENSFSRFDAGGHSWLILAIEKNPGDRVLDWANAVVDGYPEHLVLLITHKYMDADGSRYDLGQNLGENIWDKLVSKHSNFFMVLCGHTPCSPMYRMDKGEYSNEVHQIQVNYQHIGQGGDGWLRILTFNMGSNIIEVQDYSPLLDKYSSDPLGSFVISFSNYKHRR